MEIFEAFLGMFVVNQTKVEEVEFIKSYTIVN